MGKATTWYSIRRHTAIAAAVLASATAAGQEPPKSSAEILIYGDIGESWWSESVSAGDFVRELGALDVEAITVRINSIGGSCPDGIAIHNAMKRHKAHITTIVDGMALSVASLIACGGDTVQMAENATFMVHAPWTYAMGNSVELREVADQLDVWAKAISTSYDAKTGNADAMALMSDGKDHWYTAAEAKDARFIDEVISAAPILAMAGFDLTKFRDVPAHVQARLTNPTAAAPAASTAATTAPLLEITPMDPKEVAAAEAAQKQALDAARAEGAKAESQRRTDVAAAFKPFAKHEGMAEIEAACLADGSINAAVAGQRILAQMAKGAVPVAGAYAVTTVEDERDKRVAAASQALMARAAVTGKDGKRVVADSANPFRGHSMLDLCKASLTRAGVKFEHMDKMQIVAAAITQGTTDFPILLESAMHKTLQSAYAITPDTWRRFAKEGTVSDFRTHARYRVGSLSNLDVVTELSEFKNKAIPDGEKASIIAGTKGNIINLSRQAIVNDDLGAFIGLAAALGRAAKRTVEADVYATLALNAGLGPVMGDGLTLFHATRANISTGAALTMLAIDADRVALGSQLDVGGNDFLQLSPAVLLVGLALGGTARSINQSTYDPDTANKLNKPNIVKDLFKDIVDTPRLTGTRRYLFADPMEAPVLEVAFLDGNSEPFLDTEMGFDVDGTRWKVRLDYGVAAIDYRGAVTNAGV